MTVWQSVRAEDTDLKADILKRKLNIFECDTYFLKGSGVPETVYRTAFLNGDIKVRIGSKTIFVRNHNNREDLKMPFLIPYGGTIKLRKK